MGGLGAIDLAAAPQLCVQVPAQPPGDPHAQAGGCRVAGARWCWGLVPQLLVTANTSHIAIMHSLDYVWLQGYGREERPRLCDQLLRRALLLLLAGHGCCLGFDVELRTRMHRLGT